MIRSGLIFLGIALVASLFGFGVVADHAWDGAKIICFGFLVLAGLSFLGAAIRRESIWK